MIELKIEIGDIQFKFLKKIAQKNNTTAEQYATNIIVSWLNSHIKGFFLRKMKEKTFQELKQIFGEPEA